LKTPSHFDLGILDPAVRFGSCEAFCLGSFITVNFEFLAIVSVGSFVTVCFGSLVAGASDPVRQFVSDLFYPLVASVGRGQCNDWW
jgi:hypothetical protein